MEIPLEKATYTGQLHHHDHDKLIYMGILLEKATYTGQLRHHKFIYTEIPLEKATYTGHLRHQQVHLHGNSFWKGYVHWTFRSSLTLQVSRVPTYDD